MRRPALLLAVHSARVGGAQLMALAAAERLGRDYELHLAVRRGPLRERFAAHGRLVRSSPTLPVSGASAARWGLQIARSALDALRLAVMIRRRGVRVVHVNSTVVLGPVLGARVARVPAIVHARELPLNRAGRILFRVLGETATTIVAVSGSVEAAFAAARRAQVVRIHDGIAIPGPAPRRRSFHRPLRLCLIGTVNGDGRKGQDVAIETVARLERRGLKARLELVGPIQDQASATALEELAERLGVADRVRLAGPSSRIDEVLADADVLVSCARSEPLGLTLMEALARCTPVVAAEVGGVREIVRDGQTGLLVAPDDPDAMAEAIASLPADQKAARAMAALGRRDVAARFDIERGLDGLAAQIRGHIGGVTASSP